MTILTSLEHLNQEHVPNFQAWVFNNPDASKVKLWDLDVFFDVLSCNVVCVRDTSLNLKSDPEIMFMAGHLFLLGCLKERILDELSTRRLVDALIHGNVPHHSDVYQLLTYILRYEKPCTVNWTYMMPLLALTETKWYVMHPYRSSFLIGVIQSLCTQLDKYDRRSIVCYDPLELSFKLRRAISCVTGDQRYEGKAYLGYSLDTLRHLATMYLCTVVNRATSFDVFKAQANRTLSSWLSLHKTVVNTHYERNSQRGG